MFSLHSHKRVVWLMVALFALVQTASVQAAGDVKDTVKKSFKVRSGGTLFIDIDHGNVEVALTRDDAVRVEVERSVDTNERDEARQILDRHDLAIEQHGNNVSIESRFDKDEGLWSRIKGHTQLKVRVYVLIPEDYNVDFSSGAGNVDIADVRGEVQGRTGAGNISLGFIDGPVEVSSGSGNIHLEGTSGLVEANTGAGNIEVRNVRGEVQINTGAGNITAYITEQPREDSRLTSGAGNVTVYLARRIGVDVEAEASVGSADTDFPLRVEGKWMRKSFAGSLNGGGPELRLQTGVGNVSLKKL